MYWIISSVVFPALCGFIALFNMFDPSDDELYDIQEEHVSEKGDEQGEQCTIDTSLNFHGKAGDNDNKNTDTPGSYPAIETKRTLEGMLSAILNGHHQDSCRCACSWHGCSIISSCLKVTRSIVEHEKAKTYWYYGTFPFHDEWHGRCDIVFKLASLQLFESLDCSAKFASRTASAVIRIMTYWKLPTLATTMHMVPIGLLQSILCQKSISTISTMLSRRISHSSKTWLESSPNPEKRLKAISWTSYVLRGGCAWTKSSWNDHSLAHMSWSK
ncbi:hypothetical protein EJ04DRAFT_525340 [Polyplosphaeria fusca]|uniref:Uncharacterized protein n=1 Tax=Polyplosphaeria fusca TaxID=682080 RepID=A0A9P4QWF6_9PLEO|nr:hypothetical protein EJ04DRAFT_525340 [Polyplosphaeria fusca]